MKIVLIGFMGSGKTSISKILAKNLNYRWVDMDRLIIAKSGRNSDREIFDLDGEKVFRDLETSIAAELEREKDIVISTGGGIIMNPKNMFHLKKDAITIFLKSSFFTSKNRISKKNPPPLFRDVETARNLFAQRLPLYIKYADIAILTENNSPSNIAIDIVEKIKSYENNK